jgi:predicted dinucleotide-utilizing enzyme
MDGSLIYVKTPKGVAEVGARGAQLSMVTRRVLIMMDGKRTVDELAVYVRVGEIGAVITQLESEGLAEKTGAIAATTVALRAISELAPPQTPTVARPVPEERDLGPITLEEAKRRAVRELNDRLGPEADGIAMRIEACRNIDEFRERVRDAERYVTAALGAAAAQDYLRALRRGP